MVKSAFVKKYIINKNFLKLLKLSLYKTVEGTLILNQIKVIQPNTSEDS
jgi:hypothetical protein